MSIPPASEVAVLLGGNKLNRGVQEKFARRGWRTVVVDWNERPDLRGDLHLQIDVKDARAVIAALDDAGIGRVAGVYTSIDQAVGTLSRLNAHFGLGCLPPALAESTYSKDWMKRTWEEAGLLGRRALTYGEWEPGIPGAFAGTKIIVKPDASSSSNGITVLAENHTAGLLESAFAFAAGKSLNGRATIEEYVEGTEFTVEMLADASGAIAVYGLSRKYHTCNAGANRIAVKLHYHPRDVAEPEQARIAAFGASCMAALGLRCSLGHLELMVRPDGRMTPIEIGARSSGFIASTLVDAVSGRDYLADYFQVVRGWPVQPGYHPLVDRSAMYFFYDVPPGLTVIKEGSILDYLPGGVTSLYHDRERLRPGNAFEPILSDNHRVGYEVLVGAQDELTTEAVASAEVAFLRDCFAEVRV